MHRYRSRLSGPLLDRIDLHLTFSPVPLRLLGNGSESESSSTVRERVEAARARQRVRYAQSARASCNGHASGRSMLSSLSRDARQLLEDAAESLALSARAYHRVVKVARTIADLACRDTIESADLAEALRYRPHVSK